MAFHKRLQRLIDIKKVSQADVAREVGVTESRVSIWLSGGTNKPQRTKLQKLSKFFNCDIDWLATGIGEPYLKGKSENSSITASGGSTVVSGGRDAINISGNNSEEKKLLQLTKLELEAIELNRAYGNENILKGFIKRLKELRRIAEDIY